MNKTLPSLALLVFLAHPTLARAATATIADLAPPESVVVAGVNDWAQLQGAFDSSELRKLLDEPQIHAWFTAHTKESLADLEKSLKEVDSSLEEIGWPVGMAGGAMWFGVDRESKEYTARWLGAADYADRAGDVEKILVDMIDRWADKGEAETDETDVGEVKIHSVTFKPKKGDAPAEEADNGGEGGDADDAMPPDDELARPLGPLNELAGENILAPRKLHLARVGGVLVLASDMEALERAIDRLSGESVRSIAEKPEFSATMAQLGAAQAYAAFFVRPLLDRLNEFYEIARGAGEDSHDALSELPMAPGALADALGLGETQAASVGLRFDEAGAMMEMNGGLLTPKKEGLYSLFALAGEAFKPPAFVGADTSQVYSFKLDFAGVIPLVQRVVAALPQEQRAQAQAGVAMFVAALAPLMQALGSDVMVAERSERPFTPTSHATLIALKTTDALTVSNMIQQYAPMAGLERRDFDGNEIWETKQQGFLPVPVVGIGAGYVFVGPQATVEAALRTAGRADALRLADEPRFQRAAAGLGAGATLYSYSEMRAALEYLQWTVKNHEQIVRSQMEAFTSDMDPETRKRFIDESIETSRPSSWLRDMPPAELFLKHLGDSVAELRSTPDGFRWKSRWLPAKAE